MKLNEKAIQEVVSDDFDLDSMPRNLSGPEALADFARTTPDGGTWHYTFHGTLTEAKAFVHAFRVHLSRIRERARDLGRPLNPFRTSVTYTPVEDEPNKIKISIYRSKNQIEAMRALDEIFDSITYQPESGEDT